jgi:hypothetical protein
VVDTNVPAPYRVKWQIVNTGNEAAHANQLRGGFDDGEEFCGRVRWEQSAFKGSHWIEAFVIKDDQCVATSGRFSVPIK